MDVVHALAPDDVVPLLNIKAPLIPLVPELGVLITIAPLELNVPYPVNIEIVPPVAPLAQPARIATWPPIAPY